MSEIEEFKLQLEQVEVCLVSDPNNAELLKLKEDLTSVIQLHENISELDKKPSKDIEWKVGDLCNAIYSADGKIYKASIDAINDNGTCTVTFTAYGNTENVETSTLTKVQGEKVVIEPNDGLTAVQRQEIRDAKKLKSQKKKQKRLEKEQKREAEKNKWQAFNSKASGRSKSGFMAGKAKKSIFASTTEGKVGVVGSGRPMTSFQQRLKLDVKNNLDVSALTNIPAVPELPTGVPPTE